MGGSRHLSLDTLGRASRTLALGSALVGASVCCSEPPEPLDQTYEFDPGEWNLVWSDEFDVDGAPDPSIWSAEDQRPGWVNNEAQNYVPDRLENARVESGSLVIEARRDDFEGHPYSSARLRSQGNADFTYGRFEVRARLPTGRGTWAAIWMMPTDVFKFATSCDETTGWTSGCNAWPNSGEIDIMEHVGHDQDIVHASLHMEGLSHLKGNQPTNFVTVGSSTEAFHLYAVEKTAEEIVFFADDQEVLRFKNAGEGWQTWPFNEPFYFIFNIAIGGSWGGIDGIDPDAFPARMLIDYVRVYEKKG